MRSQRYLQTSPFLRTFHREECLDIFLALQFQIPNYASITCSRAPLSGTSLPISEFQLRPFSHCPYSAYYGSIYLSFTSSSALLLSSISVGYCSLCILTALFWCGTLLFFYFLSYRRSSSHRGSKPTSNALVSFLF